jgi:hypothetical protein
VSTCAKGLNDSCLLGKDERLNNFRCGAKTNPLLPSPLPFPSHSEQHLRQVTDVIDAATHAELKVGRCKLNAVAS